MPPCATRPIEIEPGIGSTTHCSYSADSARTLCAVVRSHLVVWRVAVLVERPGIPPTFALSSSAPSSSCTRCQIHAPPNSPQHANDPSCSVGRHCSQHLVARWCLCCAVFPASFTLGSLLLLLLHAQHHRRRPSAFRALCRPPRIVCESRGVHYPLSHPATCRIGS